ncbi:LLM class flavin-dependent oxidoreductase [Stutzerimonas kirkiae]|uniref:LLM class flavin-dependent oxidoreductase n=1 Tax=Stutzerimonas kirkiae TaxID=2211392 RepID=UPI001038539F|nr:LLM class flavin-dependent oxidoreductase [Stutzerimonas kirkiae]TBV10491.1 LLM class flavin-dependent oxidoreductase [Stutzerimonas kirkiae]
MSLSISWKLPALPGATQYPGAWIQVAQAAEYAGLDGLFIPSGPGYPESFTVAAALCAHTTRLRLTTSLSTEVMLPAALAAAAQSLQSISHGRLHLHLPDSEQNSVRRTFGELLNRDQRNERIGEYLHILGHLLRPDSNPLDFSGRYFQLENAGLARRDIPPPPLLLDDSHSPQLIASHAGQCLLQADHPQRLAANLERLRAAAGEQARTLGFATRLGLIVRESAEQAWQAATAWLKQQPGGLAQASGYGDARVVGFASASVRRFELYPNLWQPVPGQPALLVGSSEQVVARLEELHALGIGHVLLEAWPSVREVLRLGEEILPRLKARGIDIGDSLAC